MAKLGYANGSNVDKFYKPAPGMNEPVKKATPKRKKNLSDAFRKAKSSAEKLSDLNTNHLLKFSEQELVLWLKKRGSLEGHPTIFEAANYLKSDEVASSEWLQAREGKSLKKGVIGQRRTNAFSSAFDVFVQSPKFIEMYRNLLDNDYRILPLIDEKKPDFSKVEKYLKCQGPEFG